MITIIIVKMIIRDFIGYEIIIVVIKNILYFFYMEIKEIMKLYLAKLIFFQLDKILEK